MTIVYGDTGRNSMGTLKTLNTNPYVNEQNLTSTALPTGANASAVPASPQVSFTINTASMVPTFTGMNVVSYKSVYSLNVVGQNTFGSTQTVYYQVNKNGSSYKTGSQTIANNAYYTVSLVDGTLANNDQMDFYIWTPATSGINYFYKSVICMPSSVDVGAKWMSNANYKFTSPTAGGYLTLTGKAGNNSSGSIYVYVANGTKNSSTIDGNSTSPVVYPVISSHSTYKLSQLQYETTNLCSISGNSTFYPAVNQNYFVTQLSYRDLFL